MPWLHAFWQIMCLPRILCVQKAYYWLHGHCLALCAQQANSEGIFKTCIASIDCKQHVSVMCNLNYGDYSNRSYDNHVAMAKKWQSLSGDDLSWPEQNVEAEGSMTSQAVSTVLLSSAPIALLSGLTCLLCNLRFGPFPNSSVNCLSFCHFQLHHTCAGACTCLYGAGMLVKLFILPQGKPWFQEFDFEAFEEYYTRESEWVNDRSKGKAPL